MKPRITLLNEIYCPASMGAETLLPSFDHEHHLGVIYGIHSKKYRPIMLEDEGIGNRKAVSAEVLQQVVDDVLWCPWRLKEDGFKDGDGYLFVLCRVLVFRDGGVTFRGEDLKGTRTYTDLIELVRLIEG